MSLFLIVLSGLLFMFAYRIYGTYIVKKWKINPEIPTPAHTKKDGIDYYPAPRVVLMGHHFASIAGAAPIIGPIIAISYGWVPVLLWIVLAGIFIGAVHDFGSLLVSVKNEGMNLNRIIEKYMGKSYSNMFILFVWFTSLLVIAAFTSIVADTFVAAQSAATSSVSFIILAIFFGYATNKKKFKIMPATIIGIGFLILCIVLGHLFPIEITRNVWILLILIYIIISSITPIWILLQPRDYLNSFLLYIVLIAAFIGFIFVKPAIEMPAFTFFSVEGKSLFPFMFLLVACGAISGYHSMFASTTISKQVNNERDIKPVAFGGMLIESFLAVLALFVAASFKPEIYTQLQNTGGPIVIFSNGLSNFARILGLPENIVNQLIILTIASFALTSLDSVARVARCLFQDLSNSIDIPFLHNCKTIISSKFSSAIITVFLGGIFSFYGWQTVWPIFGAANQLIASFAFMTLLLWLKHSKLEYKIIIFPMIFMFLVTMSGLIIMIYSEMNNQHYLLSFIAVVLTVLGFLFAKNLVNKTQ